jgi:dipeptidyl aminopeptidase/acylaminoacyl peptidase
MSLEYSIDATPVEMVIYPGEGHGLHQPAHEKDLLDREARWLERWVTQP